MVIEWMAAAMMVAFPQDLDDELLKEAYSPGSGIIELCGRKSADGEAYLSSLKNDAAFEELESGPDYRVFASLGKPQRLIVLARPRELAYPMIYCREFADAKGGDSSISSSMHCIGDKADCDAEFLAFQRHDRQVLGR